MTDCCMTVDTNRERKREKMENDELSLRLIRDTGCTHASVLHYRHCRRVCHAAYILASLCVPAYQFLRVCVCVIGL